MSCGNIHVSLICVTSMNLSVNSERLALNDAKHIESRAVQT